MQIWLEPRKNAERKKKRSPWFLKGSFDLCLAAVFVAYAILLIVVAWHHEPWLDEAQAWLLVKDSSLWDLLAHRLRYEGHPPLWYLLLWLPVKVGLPYRLYWVFPVIPAAIAAWLVLYRAPFPLVIRILIPFGFFTLYQYGVIARSYALVPPLLLWLAASYPDRLERPRRFWLPALLLVFSSVHGAVFGLAAAGLVMLDLVDGWSDLAPRVRRGHLLGYGMLVVLIGLLAAMLWPPSDVVAAIGLTEKNVVQFVNNAMTGHAVLTILVLGISFLWMDRYRTLLLYVAIMAGLFILAGHVYKIYHEGMFFLAWLVAMWLAWDRFRDDPDTERVDIHPMWNRAVRVAVIGGMVLVCLVHAWWGGVSGWNDVQKPYSGSRALGAWMLENVPPGDSVFATGPLATAALPWMDRNPFVNMGSTTGLRFVDWSTGNRLVRLVARRDVDELKRWVLQAQPDWVVVPVNRKQNRPMLDMAMSLPDYEPVQLFKGEQFWKTGVFRLDGYLLMHRVTAPEADHE